MEGWIISKLQISEFKDFTQTSIYRLVNEAEKQNIIIRVMTPEQFDILVHRDDRKSIIVDGKIQKLPDFIIPRHTGTYFARAVIRHFERLGVFVLNTSESIEIAKDKLYCTQVLTEHNLPVPNTMLGKFPVNVDIVEKNIGFPVVLKTLDGSLGKGVFLCENKKEFIKNTSLIQNIGAGDKSIIFQEFIEMSRGRDLRVFVVGGKVIACMQRISAGEDFRANYSLGGSIEVFPVTPEIEWIATQSAQVLGLQIAGVDLLFDEDGHFKICEVNSSPFLQGIETATGVNISKEIFDYIRIRLGDYS